MSTKHRPKRREKKQTNKTEKTYYVAVRAVHRVTDTGDGQKRKLVELQDGVVDMASVRTRIQIEWKAAPTSYLKPKVGRIERARSLIHSVDCIVRKVQSIRIYSIITIMSSFAAESHHPILRV